MQRRRRRGGRRTHKARMRAHVIITASPSLHLPPPLGAATFFGRHLRNVVDADLSLAAPPPPPSASVATWEWSGQRDRPIDVSVGGGGGRGNISRVISYFQSIWRRTYAYVKKYNLVGTECNPEFRRPVISSPSFLIFPNSSMIHGITQK